jgi:hypothetical protein
MKWVLRRWLVIGRVCRRRRSIGYMPVQPNDDLKGPMTPTEEEAFLVATGRLKLPEQEMDWESFWERPKANVPHDVAVQACIDGRGDR